jgi:hypothetical protein
MYICYVHNIIANNDLSQANSKGDRATQEVFNDN